MNLCIYHGGCTDGVASAWAFSQFADQPQGFYPGRYQTEPPWKLIEKAHRVYLVDFSYKQPVMQEMARRAKRPPIVLDHHATAQADLEPLLADGTLEGVFDMDRCGALITWQWFTDKTPPPLMVQVDLSDRRAPGFNEQVKGLILAVRTRPHAPEHLTDAGFQALFKRWSWLMKPEHYNDLFNEGQVLLNYYNARVKEHVDAAVHWTIGEHVVPTVNAPYYLASDVAGELAAKSPSGIGATYRIHGDGQVEFSLRSTERKSLGEIGTLPAPHVGQFAEAFAGGGGHHEAAGFMVPAVDVDPARCTVTPMPIRDELA